MVKLTDKEWVELVRKSVEYTHKGLRIGQSYMSALCDIRKDLYDIVDQSENDCFYDDKKIYNLINFLN